jgi:hypothetical protein
MLVRFSHHTDYLDIECYQLIVRITCLLVYFDFELTPQIESRFQNYKQLYKIGTHLDLPIVLLVLNEIEQSLLYDIWAVYGQNAGEYSDQVNIWAWNQDGS